MKCAVGCNKCGKQTCLECYIDNFKLNKGIIRCETCNYSFGVKVPDEYIDLAIDDIIIFFKFYMCIYVYIPFINE